MHVVGIAIVESRCYGDVMLDGHNGMNDRASALGNKCGLFFSFHNLSQHGSALGRTAWAGPPRHQSLFKQYQFSRSPKTTIIDDRTFLRS